jgi:hypothetical protein
MSLLPPAVRLGALLGALLVPTGCESAPDRAENAAADRPLTADDRLRVAKRAITQLTDPGSEAVTVPSSLPGVHEWTFYVGDHGFTVSGKDDAGQPAAVLLWEDEGGEKAVACAVAPTIACDAVTRAIARDFVPPGTESTIEPATTPIGWDLEACERATSTAALRLVGQDYRPLDPIPLKDLGLPQGDDERMYCNLEPGARAVADASTLLPPGACMLFIGNRPPVLVTGGPAEDLAQECCNPGWAGHVPPYQTGGGVILVDRIVPLVCHWSEPLVTSSVRGMNAALE